MSNLPELNIASIPDFLKPSTGETVAKFEAEASGRPSNILLMQALSEAVKDGEAQVSELRDGKTNELLAPAGGELELCILESRKIVNILERAPGEKRDEYIKTVDGTLENWTKKKSELLANGTTRTYQKVYNYICYVLNSDLQDKTPRVLSLKKTNWALGQEISNKLAQLLEDNKQSPIMHYSLVFSLGSKLEQVGRDSWYKFSCAPTRYLAAEEVAEVREAYKAISEAKAAFESETKASVELSFNPS